MAYKNIEINDATSVEQTVVKQSQFYKGFSSVDNTSSATELYDFALIKQDIINHFNTRKGERVMNPEFGCDLKRILFDQITEDTFNSIQQTINESITSFIPEIETTDVIIENNPDYDNNNLISITVKYRLRISQNPDQVTVQFI
jgi:phage baseplate assembly protein W